MKISKPDDFIQFLLDRSYGSNLSIKKMSEQNNLEYNKVYSYTTGKRSPTLKELINVIEGLGYELHITYIGGEDY